MAKEPRVSAKPPLPIFEPAVAAEMASKQMNALVDVQKDFMKTIEDAKYAWAKRIKAETELAAEFASKITAARSFPETTTVVQEWMNRRMEMFAEDSQRLAADMQKFMASATHLMPKGWNGGGS